MRGASASKDPVPTATTGFTLDAFRAITEVMLASNVSPGLSPEAP
jgi:hypothetical protein